jgi:hypothetical protein
MLSSSDADDDIGQAPDAGACYGATKTARREHSTHRARD